MEAEGARRHRRLDAQHDSVARHRRGRMKDFNAQTHENVEPFLRISVKQQNRQSVEAALCSSTNTEEVPRNSVLRQSAIQCMK